MYLLYLVYILNLDFKKEITKEILSNLILYYF